MWFLEVKELASWKPLAPRAASCYPGSTSSVPCPPTSRTWLTPGHTPPAWAQPVARQVHPRVGFSSNKSALSEALSSKKPSRIAPTGLGHALRTSTSSSL